jgi:hypothetical protein
MLVSVIICTHNPRENYLRRVLDGLQLQTLPPEHWELLLVDNLSETPLSGRFDLSWHPHARHLREEELGLSPARLRGIREAVGDVLIFVDDDTVLATNYLEQALAISAQYPFIGAWCGSSLPEYEKPLPEWVGKEVWRLTVVNVERDVWGNDPEGAGIPYGAGLCIRKCVGLHFLDRRRTNPKKMITDRKGTELSGYGDIDLALCAIDIGLGAGRFTRLQLTHLIPASRLTLDYFVRHAEGDATSQMMFRAMRGLPLVKFEPVSWLGYVRWFCHRLRKGVTQEHYEIQKAHRRGLIKGYQAAKQYLDETQ